MRSWQVPSLHNHSCHSRRRGDHEKFPPESSLSLCGVLHLALSSAINVNGKVLPGWHWVSLCDRLSDAGLSPSPCMAVVAHTGEAHRDRRNEEWKKLYYVVTVQLTAKMLLFCHWCMKNSVCWQSRIGLFFNPTISDCDCCLVGITRMIQEVTVFIVFIQRHSKTAFSFHNVSQSEGGIISREITSNKSGVWLNHLK